MVELLNPQRGPVHIQICDVQGRILFDEKLASVTGDLRKSIDARFLKGGIYILKAASGDQIYNQRFLKLPQ